MTPPNVPAGKEDFLEVIGEWLMFWRNQRQNSQADYENYLNRASGVDANMKHHLAGLLTKKFSTLIQEQRMEAAREAEEKLWKEISDQRPFLHSCQDWDFMLIDSVDAEFEACHCYVRNKLTGTPMPMLAGSPEGIAYLEKAKAAGVKE